MASIIVTNSAGTENGNITNEEFMEEAARYECVYNSSIAKISKTKTERLTVGKKSARNLIYFVTS